MKKWFMIYILAIIVFAATAPVKAEEINKVIRPDLFGLMVSSGEVDAGTVIIGGITYECTTEYYYVNGKEHINGNKDRCFPLPEEPTPDPGEEPDVPTVCNGCPDINISHPMKTFKNKRFKPTK